MDNEQVRILLDIQKQVSETHSLVTELAGPTGRVTKLEDSDNRQWWLTVAVTPFLVLFHAAARKFGVQI